MSFGKDIFLQRVIDHGKLENQKSKKRMIPGERRGSKVQNAELLLQRSMLVLAERLPREDEGAKAVDTEEQKDKSEQLYLEMRKRDNEILSQKNALLLRGSADWIARVSSFDDEVNDDKDGVEEHEQESPSQDNPPPQPPLALEEEDEPIHWKDVEDKDVDLHLRSKMMHMCIQLDVPVNIWQEPSQLERELQEVQWLQTQTDMLKERRQHSEKILRKRRKSLLVSRGMDEGGLGLAAGQEGAPKSPLSVCRLRQRVLMETHLHVPSPSAARSRRWSVESGVSPGVAKGEELSISPGVAKGEELSISPGVAKGEELSISPGVTKGEELSISPGVTKGEELIVGRIESTRLRELYLEDGGSSPPDKARQELAKTENLRQGMGGWLSAKQPNGAAKWRNSKQNVSRGKSFEGLLALWKTSTPDLGGMGWRRSSLEMGILGIGRQSPRTSPVVSRK